MAVSRTANSDTFKVTTPISYERLEEVAMELAAA
jgi:hypothetical protein